VATSFDPAVLPSCEKDALITTLLAQVDALMARVTALETENAALREKLEVPPKTPDNSGTPPSQGRMATASPAPRPRRTPERTARCIPTRPVARRSARSAARTAAPT